MALEKHDLEQIKQIVDGSVQKSEERLRKEIHATVEKSENKVISILTREITDLSEINRGVIDRLDNFSDLEKRVMRIEHKLGIT